MQAEDEEEMFGECIDPVMDGDGGGIGFDDGDEDGDENEHIVGGDSAGVGAELEAVSGQMLQDGIGDGGGDGGFDVLSELTATQTLATALQTAGQGVGHIAVDDDGGGF